MRRTEQAPAGPWVALALGISVTLASLSSRAQQPTASAADLARAEALFSEGRRLMGEERFPEACPKLAESHRIDPGGGTLFNLAFCHWKEGKTASAWAAYKELMMMPHPKSKEWDSRIQQATDALKEIEPALSYLIIEVPPATASLPGLSILRDGTSIKAPEWGVPVPVDPGEHLITVSATGKLTRSDRIPFGSRSERKTHVVAPLTDAPPASSAPPTASSAPPAPSATSAPAASSIALPTQELKPPASSSSTGWIVGGAGLVALGLGGYFGYRASSQWDDAKARCPEVSCADRDAVDLRDKAKTSATLANFGVGLGLAGIGVGAYLLFTSPDPSTARRSSGVHRAQLSPTVAPGLVALSVDGRWLRYFR